MYPVSEDWSQQLTAQIRQASGLMRLEIGSFDTMEDQVQWELSAQHWNITTQSKTSLPAQSVEVCGKDGVFSQPPAVTLSFSQPVELKGVCMNFGCVFPAPKRIVVSLTDAQGGEHSQTFENLYSVANFQILAKNIRRMVISFPEMPLPYARIALYELKLGEGYVYTEQDISELNETKTISPAGLELPRGELDFSLNNSDGAFNADSKAHIHDFLRENQKICLWYGLRWADGEEWIPAGKWYLQSWSAQQKSATFKAVDRIAMLNKTTFEKGVYTFEWKQLSEMAATVLKDCGLEEQEWYFAPEFFMYTMAPIPIVSHAQALQILANRAKMNLYSDRSGKICIAPIKNQPVLSLDKTQVFESPSVRQSTLLKQVNSFWTLRSYYINTRETIAQLRMSAQEGAVRVEHGILLRPEIQCTPQAQVQAEHYARVSYLTIPNQSGEFEVKIVGQKISEVTYPLSVENAAEGEILEIDNPLMDAQQSVEVLEWVKDQYAHTLEYELEIRGMPQLDAGDWVELWTGVNGQVVESKLNYNGAFHQTLKILA